MSDKPTMLEPCPGDRVKTKISKREITGTVVLVTVPGAERLAIVWDGVLSQYGKVNFDLLDVDPADGRIQWSFGGEIVAPVEAQEQPWEGAGPTPKEAGAELILVEAENELAQAHFGPGGWMWSDCREPVTFAKTWRPTPKAES